MLRPVLDEDKRAKHKDEVILRALEVSKEKYGAFTFDSIHVNMTPSRAMSSTKSGRFINIFIAPASEAWEKQTIPVKVPIRLGLLSYRLLLIDKANLETFNAISTLEELRPLSAGLQRDWVTTEVFKASNMNMVIGHKFEGLFLMLNKRRFDYLPRAIYEIHDELNNRADMLKDVVIEPTLALHVPMPTYVYVSPEHPRIAKRLEYGLKKMSKTGELKNILFKYYKLDIERANLSKRKVIKIPNPYFHDNDVLNDDELWLRL